MTVKDSIAKVILWAYIKVRGLELMMGGLGHGIHVCGIEPWKGPDGGPWEGVCSPRVCPYHEVCLKKWGR